MGKTLCIDGQNLLKQSFHGNKTTFTEFGQIGAIVTFYMIIRKLIKEYHFDKVILFWDGYNSGKLRYNIYPDYKSNRNKNWHLGDEMILSDKDVNKALDPDEESILMQRTRIQQYAEELFIRQIEDPVCEADDCIAYYTMHLKEADEEVMIYSADHDLCQLIDDNVKLYLWGKKHLITKGNYSVLYFNHHIKNAGLIKAIEGCSGDVVHGVENMGEKTLLKHFPELRTQELTFDYIYDKAVEINSKRKKPYVALQNLIDGKTSVENAEILGGKHLFELNYKLVNLREPFLTEACIESIVEQTMSPLDDENRGGKNLLRLMYEDGFIKSIPNGPEGYKNFLVEFLPVVNREKQLYKKYLKNNG